MYIYVISVLTVFLVYVIHKYFAPRRGFRGLVIIYWLKWLWRLASIKLWQFNLPSRLNCHGDDEGCGVIPTVSDTQMESPKSLITDRHEDGVLLWGGDEKGRCVLAKVIRKSRKSASVFLMVKDQENNLYTLPNQPDSNVVNVETEDSWVGNGLLMECIEPMRTWRIKFNGLLRRGNRVHYITDDDEDEDDDDIECDQSMKEGKNSSIIHARIDFLWKAMKPPHDIWKDSSGRLLAHSLARGSFTDWSAFRALDMDGYDQWGALHGTLKLGVSASQTWYLRGARQHRWGMSNSATTLQRAATLFAYFSGGDLLCLEGFSYDPHGTTHCVMGYLQTAAGNHYPVTATSFDLYELQNKDKPLRNIFVTCTAGGRNFNVWWRLYDGISHYTGDPWTLQNRISPTHSASTYHGDGFGLTIITKRFNDLCPVPEKERLYFSNGPIDSPQKNSFIILLSDNASTSASLTGGKGSSLAYLKCIEKKISHEPVKFCVPNGVVVTSEAWNEQIASSSELRNAILHLEKAVTSSHLSRIKDACSKMKTVMEGVAVIPEISDQLKQQLLEMFPGDDTLTRKRFAVRSSACGEDSTEASSAGQNETILGCFWIEQDSEDPHSITKALVSCWGSQFSFQSVEYRRQRGQAVNGGMAVVIQEMVDAQIAGVMFTREPLNGNPSIVTITANYGLGESVVSASAEPDTVEVRRTWRNKLRIKSRQVGAKKTKYVMKEIGGTSEVEMPPEEGSVPCLSDEDSLRLARIGIMIEDYFGSPRDVEFALSHKTIYLLQSRPVTFLNEWTDYELIHEMDTAFISDREISSLANVGEVFPGYTTPLTMSSVVKMLDLSIQKVLYQREFSTNSYCAYCLKSMAISQGHCLLNLGELFYRQNEEKITMVNHAVDLGVFGRLVTTPEIHQWGVDRFGILTKAANLYRTAYAFYEMFFNPRSVKRIRPLFASYEIETARVHSSQELYKEISRKLPELLTISEMHCHTSTASTMTQCIALVALGENKAEITPKLIQDMATLLGCISETESAEIPVALKNLAKAISENEEVEEFLQMTPDEGKVWLESHPESVGNTFRDFLHKHGHRCIKEFELRSMSWGIAPDTLVKTLQTMVKNPQSFESAKKTLDIEKVLEGMNTSLNRSKKRALRFILKLCGSSVTLRESTKSLLIRTVDTFRKAYRTLGQLMVSECRLPDAELIFFLQHREIGILLETRSVALVTKAIRRRKLMPRMEKTTFQEIFFGVPAAIQEIDEESVEGDAKAEVIRGTPVCNGVAIGTARVVTSLQDASEIQNGDILLTFCTDVGWTPYFPLLSGVVTEIGGLISHGAVVAREYGLPCIVGVTAVTRKIKSGDKVQINGGEGYIKVL